MPGLFLVLSDTRHQLGKSQKFLRGIAGGSVMLIGWSIVGYSAPPQEHQHYPEEGSHGGHRHSGLPDATYRHCSALVPYIGPTAMAIS